MRPCLNNSPREAVALRWRPSTRQPEVSLSSRWASTGGRGKPKRSASKDDSRLAPPFGPRCTGSPAGLSITSISPSRWSTRAWISSAVSSAASIGSQDFRLQDFFCKTFAYRPKRLTQPPDERQYGRKAQAELVAAAVQRAEADLEFAGFAGRRSRHQAQA